MCKAHSNKGPQNQKILSAELWKYLLEILPTLKTHFNELTYNASGLSLLIILIAIIKTITHDFCKSGSFPIAIAATRKFIF